LTGCRRFVKQQAGMAKTPVCKRLNSGLDPIGRFHVKKTSSQANHGFDPEKALVKTIDFFY
jgi:hypothetical protein